jgi:3-hydroxybutyryl-CoA dehydrogenase
LNDLRTIAVIGAGRLGRRLAWLSARAGYRTILEDVFPSNLRRAEELLEESLAAGRDGGGLIRRVEFAGNVEDAVREADLIVDCVPDELESKLEIFSLLDRMAPPRSILATPTRALSIADLASCTYRADRCVALELPPELLDNEESPLAGRITIVHTNGTLPEVVDAVAGFSRRIGMEVGVRADALEAAPDS